MKTKKETYWKTFMGIPRYKIDWYFKYWLYKIFGFTFDKLKNQREYWNTRGKEYMDDFLESQFDKKEMFFQDLLTKELKMLSFVSIFEAGCGFGWNVKRIKKEFPNVFPGGLDFSLPQLLNGQKYIPEVHMPCVQGDACNMPFKDNAFEVGFTMGVFMNIHPLNIDKAIDEMLRISKKYIIHIEWDQNNTKSELREKRIFKTNIVSHDYKTLYEKCGRKIIKFNTYKDFEHIFYEQYTHVKESTWEQFEGPEKYILIIIEV
jgi:ubiquinone/menaquinone biosynthesis C-methylase UbiE